MTRRNAFQPVKNFAFALTLILSACDDSGSLPGNNSATGGSTASANGGAANATGGVNAGGVTAVAGATSSTPTGSAVSAMPAVGEGMITNWSKKPYLFGPWFTFGWGATGGSVCTPTPEQGITTTERGMCITWTGCGVSGQGAAVGFKVCAAPKYPNETGDSSWFPLACTGSNIDACVPSEQAKPIGFCGGAVKGVSFSAMSQSVSVSFLDDVGTNGTVLETVVVAAGTTTAAFQGEGSKVAAVHFKVIDPTVSGELCVADVKIVQ